MKKLYGVVLFLAAIGAVWANPIPERIKGLARERCEFRSVGPGGGGWIQSMLLSRHAPGRLFVGCDVGGFYLSEDGGKSYEMRNRGLGHFFVETIAEHPANPDVLFLGSQGGIYKTTDRGRSWQEKRTGLPPVSRHAHTVQISKFAFHPANPDVLFALVGQPRTLQGARGEVWRSDDGGESWRMIVKSGLAKDVNLFDVSIDPRDGNRLLVASNRGLFRSENGGADWVPSNDGLPAHLRTRHLARCPAQPDVVYVTLRQKGGEKPWSAGVYRSADGGRTWEARTGGFDRRAGNPGCGDELCTWTDCIAVHPTNPDVVWTGGASWWYTGVLKTEDGGRAWKQVFNADRGWISFWGPSVKTMTLSAADPNRLAFGTSGMVYATEDGGANWEQRYFRDLGGGRFVGTGLEVTCLHTVVPSVHRRGRVYFGYYDIGLLRTDDDGRSFRRTMTGIPHDFSNSCFALAEAPDDAQTLWGCFGSWGGGGKAIFARSGDGGETWQPCTNAASGWKGAAVNSLLVAGTKPNARLMAAGPGGLQVSADGGTTWTVPDGRFPEAGRVRFLARGGETVYAAVAGTAREGASVFACRADGRWERLTPPALRIADLHGLAAEGNRVLVTAREHFNHQTREFRPGGAWLSVDAGATWKKVWTDPFVDAALVAQGELYIALADNPYHDHCAGAGVLHSVDDGATWTSLDGPGLQNWNVHALAADPFAPQRLWMGTGGNSVFVLEKGRKNVDAIVSIASERSDASRMNARVIQPAYASDEKGTYASFEWMIGQLESCDPSLDLIVLPEFSDVPGRIAYGAPFYAVASNTNHRLLAACAATAKRCRAVVFVNCLDYTEKGPRNTTWAFDRTGRNVGRYYKRHVTAGERDKCGLDVSYTRAWTEPYTVTIDGLKYAFLTCYDFYFYDSYDAIAKVRPDIVIGCSLQRSDRHDALEFINQFCAYNTAAYLVRASVSMGLDATKGGSSMVVAPTGKILGNLRSRVGVLDVSFDPKAKYLKPAGYGNPPSTHPAYCEIGRRPWQYRPAGPSLVPPLAEQTGKRLCAHRGFSAVAPENSLPAYGAAVALGAGEVELDLWWTKDGEIVSIHDGTIDRISNGRGNVRDMTYAELCRFDFGTKEGGPHFKGLRILRFREILAKLTCQTLLNIHVKMHPGETKLVELVDLIRAYDAERHVYFMTENEDLQRALAKVAPEIPRCMGWSAKWSFKDHVAKAVEHRCWGLQLFKPHFDAETVRAAHAAGLRVNVFWSDDPAEAKKFLDWGVDTLLTNDYQPISFATGLK